MCIPCALATCGSWCISGSIWGLRRGKRTTMSPCLRRYCCPPAMCTTFSWTTSLRIITAAVSRRVSVRMLSAERKGQQSGWCQKGASMSLNQLCPKAWEVKMFADTPEWNKISNWNKAFFFLSTFHAGSSYVPNTGVVCVSSGLTGECCIEERDLISDLRASMASGWVSRKPRSQKAAGPLLHWGENEIRVNTSNKTDASRTKICWHALHIFTHRYAEKPVNHFVGAAVSLLGVCVCVWGGAGGGSHLSLSCCKCYELRELLFLPLHISGQLSVDSRDTRTRTAESASQCLFLPS